MLFPFCDSAQPISDLYRTGCKILAANIDPLPLLVAEARLTALDHRVLTDTFIRLGDSLTGGRTLRQRIQALYQTACPSCQTSLQADYFVWHREAADPQQKGIQCEHCGFKGQIRTTQADLYHLDRIETRGLHYHFLLGRTIAPDTDDKARLRTKLESLLELYTPRALYAIAEIVMKVEAGISDKAVQRIFKTILLQCLLAASNLFSTQATTQFPNRLQLPGHFVERNIWQLFTTTVANWSVPERPTRITSRMTDFLHQRQNSVHFFPDNPATLQQYLMVESVPLTITTLQTPNPVVWALSTLWSGWLLGLKGAEPGRDLLTQKWPVWSWYQNRLVNILRALRPTLKPEARWIFVCPVDDKLHPPVIILAALQAAFEVDEWQITSSYHQVTLILPILESPPPMPSDHLQATIHNEIKDAITGFLATQGQPQSTNLLFWAAWQSLLYSGLLASALTSLPQDHLLTWLTEQVQAVLKMIIGE